MANPTSGAKAGEGTVSAVDRSLTVRPEAPAKIPDADAKKLEAELMKAAMNKAGTELLEKVPVEVEVAISHEWRK